jgi:hypothetical protein
VTVQVVAAVVSAVVVVREALVVEVRTASAAAADRAALATAVNRAAIAVEVRAASAAVVVRVAVVRVALAAVVRVALVMEEAVPVEVDHQEVANHIDITTTGVSPFQTGHSVVILQ